MSTDTRGSRTLASIIEQAKQSPYARGHEFDASNLAAADLSIILAHGHDIRVRVRDQRTGYERTGLVSRTTGWRPSFLLMSRRGVHSSSDILGPDDVVVAVQRGGKYVPGRWV